MANDADFQFLMDAPLGKDLSAEECSVLASKMTKRQLRDGDYLVKSGDKIRTLFILESGSLTVNASEVGHETVLYTMGIGECAGTRSFVEGTPRKASLRAAGDTTVHALEPDAFESLLATHPMIVYKVMRGMFRQTHANLVKMDVNFQQLSNYISKTGGRY
jgi:CRP-like cAMP-binding protein